MESNENVRPITHRRDRSRFQRSSFWQICDNLSGVLLLTAAIFSPWAFGTTQVWSIWTMNVIGYTTGLLLFGKLLADRNLDKKDVKLGRLSTFLAILTLVILVYILIGTVNARATYLPGEWRFEFHSFISWLPHTYSATHSWKVFWSCLAFACFFWSTRRWLLDGQPSIGNVPRRVRTLIWILTINGALLALESIVQRTAGGNKLLFIQETRINNFADAQLGPFAYRSNGAQYLNLIWPMSLGLWATVRSRTKRNLRNLLLPCVMLMISAPMLSLSRGGAIVTLSLVICSTFIIVFAKSVHWVWKAGSILLLTLVAYAGLLVGGDKLKERMGALEAGFEGRESINEIGRKIAADYPLFGTGPGTMNPVYNLYRGSLDEYWPAQLHNDWLETLATFGWLGFSLILLALLICALLPFSSHPSSCTGRFFVFLWLALLGCLVHARYDFPFQIYSIVLVFLLICSILSSCSLRNENG